MPHNNDCETKNLNKIPSFNAYRKDIPKYGFGTAHVIRYGPTNEAGSITESQFRELLDHAIGLGVRRIDCAPFYGTQKLVGEVLDKLISDGTVYRKDLFITSQLPINMMRPENVVRSIKRTLRELRLTYVDLFLIHAPFGTKNNGNDDDMFPLDSSGRIVADTEEFLLESAWTKLVELKKLKFFKYIGLSNVDREQLDRCNRIHQIDVVQNEYHLYNSQRDLIDYCDDTGVHFEAHTAFGCPQLARQLSMPTFDTDPVVLRIAHDNNLTPPQVINQWLHSQPISHVIRSDNISQLEENVGAAKSIDLSMNEMIELDVLNRNWRLNYFDQYKGLTAHPEYVYRTKLIKAGCIEGRQGNSRPFRF